MSKPAQQPHPQKGKNTFYVLKFTAVMGLLLTLVLAGILVIILIGKAPPNESLSFTKQSKEQDAVDVVFIVVDTLAVDYTSAYGSLKNTTPYLESLARDGIKFTNAYSSSPWTVPSMHSMMTGLYPSELTVTKPQKKKRSVSVLSSKANTLAEILKQNGYRTFGVSTNALLTSRFGFAQGFDRFIEAESPWLPYPNKAVLGAKTQMQNSSKYFLWLHYFQPHQPFFDQKPWFDQWNESKFKNYNELATDMAKLLYKKKQWQPNLEFIKKVSNKRALPMVYRAFRDYCDKLDNEYRKFIKAAYMSEIRATDEAMKKALAALGVDDRTLIVFTSNHGEELFEHGRLGHHGHALHQELVKVPLVIRLPKGKGAGQVIDTPVSLVDLMPTILELAGVEAPNNISGKSFIKLLEGKDIQPRPLFFEIINGQGDVRAILEYPWKFIYNKTNGKESLFKLNDDPSERNNLVDANGERAQAMRKKLLEWMEKNKSRWPDEEPIKLSPKEIHRLFLFN